MQKDRTLEQTSQIGEQTW